MPGYLLDTNHVQALFCEEAKVIAKIQSLPANAQVRVCTITLGEIEAGHQMTLSTNPGRRSTYTAFVNQKFLPNALPISHATRIYYAQIIGRIWRKHPPPPGRKTERHLVELGVDINDVWAVAVAWEHGLIFVTSDAMTCIRDEVAEVTFESWQ